MSRHLRALVAAAIATLALAATVSAHDITSVTVNCDDQSVTITGVNFPATKVQVSGTGASDYSAQFEVQGNWTKVLDGPLLNGLYLITWPEAGRHATSFVVACEQATPTPATPTPTPDVTPTPSPEPTPTQAPSEAPSATPSGSELAVAGPPSPDVTPPPTDAAAPARNQTAVLLIVVFIVAAAIAALGVTAASRRR